jgi:GTP-binding protein
MRFIDEATIDVVAGDGGNGCVSFLRDSSALNGGPNGGDGGRGGDVVLVATSSLTTLQDFRGRKIFKAQRGGDGQSKRRHGANGSDLEVRLPVGTVVRDAETGEVVVDLIEDGERFVLARGGRGGFGNQHFATPTRQAPDFARPGRAGEERRVTFTLKVIADVGLVGLPNAGKSSLIRQISASKAKVGAYPFTTLSPNLGVASMPGGSFVVADIPGLIEGAHDGAGLGDTFLRHVERTRMLVYVVGLGPGEDPLSSYDTVRAELASYDPALLDRPALVAVNKIDTVDRAERDAILEPLRKRAAEHRLRLHVLSCATGEGVKSLLRTLADAVHGMRPAPEPEPYDPTRFM